jgi:RimJ/RimL family protein N-acetyltransferase
LASLLLDVTERPLFARTAKDNVALIRVLEKCGFERYGHDESFANGRNAVTEGVLLILRPTGDAAG